MTEATGGDIRIRSGFAEIERLSTLAPAQIAYHQAAIQTRERAWQVTERAQSRYYDAVGKASLSLEHAASTLEALYESFNIALEAAIEAQDPNQFGIIIDKYAEVLVTLVETSTYPSQPDYDETMAKARDVANTLRENVQTLRESFDLVATVYIPLPSWNVETMPTPAPVLATVQTQDGELALNLCDDSLNPHN